MSTDFDPSKDHYKALGVAPTATAEEIKKAYRRLAKQCHPDSTGGDKTKESRFKEISNAYDVLGSAKTRAQYDAVRAGGGRSAAMGGASAGFSVDPRTGATAWDLSDLFAQHFSSGNARAGQRMRIDPFDFVEPEPRRRSDATSDAEFESTVRAADGSWLKVVGMDVHSDVRVPFDRAILGTVAAVATIDGRAEVKIPPGSSSGKRLRLRGKGRLEGGRHGDHYITIHIDVPNDLDDEAKKLLVQLTTQLRKRGRGE